MITIIEANKILWQEVNTSPLKAAITGGVYKDVRPTDSTVEDVIVNTIVAPGSELLIQRCVGNVNIHVPPLLVNNSKDYIPNQDRLEGLGNITKSHFEGVYRHKYTMFIEGTELIQEPNKDAWFLNIRIRLIFHNNIQ